VGEDYNINIRNGMGGGGKTASQQKLSAKGSIKRAENKWKAYFKKYSRAVSSGKADLIEDGKQRTVMSIVSSVVRSAEKIGNFGINYYEASTGNEMRSHNYRTTLKTITSMGMNYLSGAIENEIFTKQIISRQNYSMDYGRELYQINVDGTKNKRI
jgi:hypothetical protein